MIRYNIARLANQTGKHARGSRVVLAPLSESLGARRAYLAALRRLIRAIAVEVNASIIPVVRFERQLRIDRSGLTHDVDEGTFTRLKSVILELTGITNATVRRILDLEAQRHSETFMDEAKSALGIDISMVVQQSDLDGYMRAAIARNTSLIKSLADDAVKRVEQSVIKNNIAGGSAKNLQGILTEEFGIVDSRAKVIARDQTAKFNSDLNRIRQQQAEIDAYNWTTSHDERVRERHREIDGNRYEWGQPTGAEEGLPPGQPILCRCIARAIIEF